MIRIAITDRQKSHKLDKTTLRRVARDVLQHEGVFSADISLVFVDDAEMQALNQRHLEHDYPTDVLCFLMDESDAENARYINAEVIASTETAVREAPGYDWHADAELTLYVVHGLLHACGYDDLDSRSKTRMRRAERGAMQRHGLEVRYRNRR